MVHVKVGGVLIWCRFVQFRVKKCQQPKTVHEKSLINQALTAAEKRELALLRQCESNKCKNNVVRCASAESSANLTVSPANSPVRSQV